MFGAAAAPLLIVSSSQEAAVGPLRLPTEAMEVLQTGAMLCRHRLTAPMLKVGEVELNLPVVLAGLQQAATATPTTGLQDL